MLVRKKDEFYIGGTTRYAIATEAKRESKSLFYET
jgi:hypothetical protein